MGFVIDVTVSGFESIDRSDMLIARLVLQLIGIVAIGTGAAAIMKSDLGAGPSELLTTAISAPRNWSEPRVRTGVELSCLTVGVMLGGPIGIGTGMFAMIIGTSVQRGHRLVDRILSPGDQEPGRPLDVHPREGGRLPRVRRIVIFGGGLSVRRYPGPSPISGT